MITAKEMRMRQQTGTQLALSVWQGLWLCFLFKGSWELLSISSNYVCHLYNVWVLRPWIQTRKCCNWRDWRGEGNEGEKNKGGQGQVQILPSSEPLNVYSMMDG